MAYIPAGTVVERDEQSEAALVAGALGAERYEAWVDYDQDVCVVFWWGAGRDTVVEGGPFWDALVAYVRDKGRR